MVTQKNPPAGGQVSTGKGWLPSPPRRLAAPLRDQVLDVVRQAILDFQMRPGQRLIERELIEQLGVSRATVREVVARLASERLMEETTPPRGRAPHLTR